MYCLKCKKDTDTKNAKVLTAKNGKPYVKGTCAVCNKNKCTFIKKEDVGVYEKEIKGGFLPLLALPALIAAGKAAAGAAALGAAGAAGQHIYKKVTGTGMYLKGGKGVFLNPDHRHRH